MKEDRGVRMKNEDSAQTSTDSMPSQACCYYSNCDQVAKWEIASSVAKRNPDGSPLTLYTCDEHYENLTGDLRKAGTPYTLSPVNGPHMVPPFTPEENFDELIKNRSIFYKAFTYIAVALVGIVIAPFMIIYYGGKWVLANGDWQKQDRDG
jgi:hypothetical protein